MPANATSNLLIRLWQYQLERFPILLNGLVIGVMTFATLIYSRASRGVALQLETGLFIAVFYMAFSTFFLLRIADEFKDAAHDRQFRTYLPVPRGLISLQALGYLGFLLLVGQLLFLALVVPGLWPFYLLLASWWVLMRYEFFAGEWLKRHPFWYVLSHMCIVPLILLFISAADWFLEKAAFPAGLWLFLGISFLGGLQIEIGRKLRGPDDEEPGVDSYTRQLGFRPAIFLWMGLLVVTLLSCLWAGRSIGRFYESLYTLIPGWLVLMALGMLFLKRPTTKKSKYLEYGSAFWVLLQYVALGVLPYFLG